jgi:hypothetical protein
MRTIDLSDPNSPAETAWFDTEAVIANKVLVEDEISVYPRISGN